VPVVGTRYHLQPWNIEDKAQRVPEPVGSTSRVRRRAIARVRRRTIFLVLRWLLRCTGFGGARKLGAFFGALNYRLDGRTRRICLDGVAAVLKLGADDPRVCRTVRSAFRVNTIGVMEVLSMVDRKLDSQHLHRLCKVDGIENLHAARKGGGAILLATHSGNSLLMAAQLAEQGMPITIVYRQSPMMSPEFIAEGLAHYGFDGIAANGGFRAYARMLDGLRHNRVLFAMMDDGVRRSDEDGLPLRFLGKDMRMPGGVVQLARQSRAPILPVSSLAADPAWHFRIEPRLTLVPGGTIEEDLATVLHYVEGQIMAHPELWSWHQRRWRKHPLVI
jgi:KDO2-lipid IV(A) lauroyltransferase